MNSSSVVQIGPSKASFAYAIYAHGMRQPMWRCIDGLVCLPIFNKLMAIGFLPVSLLIKIGIGSTVWLVRTEADNSMGGSSKHGDGKGRSIIFTGKIGSIRHRTERPGMRMPIAFFSIGV